MGIEGIFKTLQKIKNSGIYYIKKGTRKDITNLYIDFNAIVYTIGAKIESELSYLLCKIIYEPTKYKTDREVIQIAAKFQFELADSSKETYNDYFIKNAKSIDKYIITAIQDYIINDILIYLNEKSLSNIYISMDGIPIMGKIIEQKHRRYMGYIHGKLNNKIYDKYKGGLSSNHKYIIENRYKFDTGKITTFSSFMPQLESALSDSNYKNRICEIFRNVKHVKVSGVSEYGEGEKKIMEEIMNNKSKNKDNKFIIVSPDADLILLSMSATNVSAINNNKITVDIMKIDNDDNSVSYIDISIMKQYLANYVLNKLDNRVKHNDILEMAISNDFIFIATLFGNDFLPKIISINVKTDFEILMSKYIYMFDNKYKLRQIVAYNADKKMFEIDFVNFEHYIKRIYDTENELMFNKYISDKYDIYKIKKMVKTIEKNNFNFYIEDYIDDYITVVNSQQDINIIANNILLNKMSLKMGTRFCEMFLMFETGYNNNNKLNAITERLKAIRNEHTNNIMYPFVNARKSNSINNYNIEKYYSIIYNRYILDREKQTEYDTNIIMIEMKYGIYKTMLNDNNGDKPFDFRIENNKLQKPQIDYEKYNEEYMETQKMDNIMEDYIGTLCWVVNQYFNMNYVKDAGITTWFYNYDRSPLIKDIYETVKKYNRNNITYGDIIQKLRKYNIEQDKYLSKEEHMMYIMPKPSLMRNDAVINNSHYMKIIDNNPDIFPDVDTWIDEILKMNGEKYIDCRKSTFINKCILKKVINKEYNDYISLMR